MTGGSERKGKSAQLHKCIDCETEADGAGDDQRGGGTPLLAA